MRISTRDLSGQEWVDDRVRPHAESGLEHRPTEWPRPCTRRPLGYPEALEAKVESLRRSQTAGKVSDGYPPSFLLTLAMATATAWSVMSPFGPSLKPLSSQQLAVKRECVARRPALS
ncbi:hypothetical protein [Mycobacterium marinum]|uniref:hypothetical protein n=1 Tax=Mycobacterium marinum TaxID=1781 RepID=UPI003B42948D